jgi:hypothetical protein
VGFACPSPPPGGGLPRSWLSVAVVAADLSLPGYRGDDRHVVPRVLHPGAFPPKGTGDLAPRCWPPPPGIGPRGRHGGAGIGVRRGLELGALDTNCTDDIDHRRPRGRRLPGRVRPVGECPDAHPAPSGRPASPGGRGGRPLHGRASRVSRGGGPGRRPLTGSRAGAVVGCPGGSVQDPTGTAGAGRRTAWPRVRDRHRVNGSWLRQNEQEGDPHDVVLVPGMGAIVVERLDLDRLTLFQDADGMVDGRAHALAHARQVAAGGW